MISTVISVKDKKLKHVQVRYVCVRVWGVCDFDYSGYLNKQEIIQKIISIVLLKDFQAR